MNQKKPKQFEAMWYPRDNPQKATMKSREITILWWQKTSVVMVKTWVLMDKSLWPHYVSLEHHHVSWEKSWKFIIFHGNNHEHHHFSQGKLTKKRTFRPKKTEQLSRRAVPHWGHPCPRRRCRRRGLGDPRNAPGAKLGKTTRWEKFMVI